MSSASGAGGGTPGGTAATAVVFARTPGELDADSILDYSTKEGRTKFKHATSELSDVKFDGKSGGINSFHEKLLRRARECGWIQGNGDIVTVNGVNSISHYGRVTTEDIKAEAELYVDNSSRKTQNNEQMYRCIMNSLTEECSNRIINRPSEYTIQVGGTAFVSAILLHKALMQRAIVDTRSTSSNFRTNLSSLDTYMPLVNSNIEKFNEYVSTCVLGLEARGETSEDLLDFLFKGYKVAADKKFVEYIEQKETDYFDGADLTPDKLMQLAENKYAARVERGLWGGKSEEQKQIIALTSTVTSLKNSLKAKGRGGHSNKNGKGKGKGDGSDNKGSGGGKSEKKKQDEAKWAWKKIPPKNNQKTKVVDSKTYYWCPKHEAWTLHKPEDCNKKGKGSILKPEKDDGKTNTVSFSASVGSIMEQLEEDNDE